MINEMKIEEGWLTQKGDIADDLRTFQKHIIGVKATVEFWKVVNDDYKVQFEASREAMDLWNKRDTDESFLSNFREFIVERLTYNGTGLTLTLSQEVRNAIHAAEDEYGIENIIITQKGWTISPAPN